MGSYRGNIWKRRAWALFLASVLLMSDRGIVNAVASETEEQTEDVIQSAESTGLPAEGQQQTPEASEPTQGELQGETVSGNAASTLPQTTAQAQEQAEVSEGDMIPEPGEPQTEGINGDGTARISMPEYHPLQDENGVYTIDFGQIPIDLRAIAEEAGYTEGTDQDLQNTEMIVFGECFSVMAVYHYLAEHASHNLILDFRILSDCKVKLIGMPQSVTFGGDRVECHYYIDNKGEIVDYAIEENPSFYIVGIGNHGAIRGGTFDVSVNNASDGVITGGTFNDSLLENFGTICGGTFQNGYVYNYTGTIQGGTFQCEYDVYNGGTIQGGDFRQTELLNDDGAVQGGIFRTGAAGIPEEASCIFYDEAAHTYTVQGNVTIYDEFTLQEGETLTIPEDASLAVSEGAELTVSEGADLTVAEGAELTNNGVIENKGSIHNSGDIQNSGSGRLDGTPVSGNQARTNRTSSYYDPVNQCVQSAEATVIEASTRELTSGWYIVSGDVSIPDRIEISGDVHLILADGAQLNAGLGIHVKEGNSLTIWGQSAEYESNGLLSAYSDNDQAGIGGNRDESSGQITINGGRIYAYGGNNDGAGIGGGNAGNGYVTVNGGEINAYGAMLAAGIGGGLGGDGVVTVTGGHVCAYGGDGSGSGLGGGCDGAGKVTITGGVIQAVGHDHAAGIGGGQGHKGEVTITGGYVCAEGGKGCDIGDGISETDSPIPDKGSFSTGENGNAIIQGTVSDQSNRENWRGVVENTVYGDVVLERELTLDGDLTIPEGSSLTVTENGSIQGKGTVVNQGNLENKGEIKSDVSNDGTLKNSGRMEGTVVNDSTLENHGEITGNVANNGTLNNGEDGSIQYGTVSIGEEGQITNNGRIESDTVVNDGSLTNTETGTLAGDEITNNNEMVNSGKVESDQVTNKGTLENHGNIEADVANDGTLTGDGSISPVTPDDKEQGNNRNQNTDKGNQNTGRGENKEIEEQEKESADSQPQNKAEASGRTAALALGAEEENLPDRKNEETETAENTEEKSNIRNVRAQMKDGRIVLADGDSAQTAETEQGGGQSGLAVGTEELADTDAVTIAVGTGNITVQVAHDGYPYAAGLADAVSVVNAVLTEEQIQRVYDGEEMQLRISMTEISDRVSEEDRGVIAKGLEESGYAPGTYIDISLNLKIGNGAWNAVTQTREPVEVVVGVPETLLADGRIYEIARSHDGGFALLQDLDDTAETVTVATDLFSAYAIVYQDGVSAETAERDSAQKAKCGLCHICPTFLGVCCFVWLAILIAAIALACAVLYVILYKRGDKKS